MFDVARRARHVYCRWYYELEEIPMIPTDASTVIRRISIDEVTERDQINDRLSCLKVMFGTTIGLNRESVDWCPDDSPPTASESIAWLWFCRPDLAPLLYTAAPEDVRELMVCYHHDRVSEWWALTFERRQP